VHFPVVPQLDWLVVAHLAWGSRVPFGTLVQVPFPVRLHAWQAFEQGLVQQTPWAQYCLPSGAGWQSEDWLHWAPGGLGPQVWLASQARPEMHWVLLDVHVSQHLLPLHT
jgi:hypothetical protein